MTGFDRRITFGAAILALLMGPARTQENLDSGKTPAQLYASDCAICHKTARGLSKAGGPFGLQGFLREHYTASREAAAAIAAYVTAMDQGAPAPERAAKRGGKPKEARKPGEAKSSTPKSETKSESKSGPKSEANGSEPAKPSEEHKPVEAKAEAAKPAAKPPAEAKPDGKKPDSEKKSD